MKSSTERRYMTRWSLTGPPDLAKTLVTAAQLGGPGSSFDPVVTGGDNSKIALNET